MANEYTALRAKIDEDPTNAAKTDAQVHDWLSEAEPGPFVDVSPTDFFEWAATYKLPGRFYATANTTPASDLQSACLMLYTAWSQGAGLQTSSAAVRTHLVDSVPGVVSNAARDDLLAVARPDVPRWVNAGWDREPILGDVVAARAL